MHRRLWPLLRKLPWLDRYKYLSHKLLRWLVAYLLVTGGVALAAGLVLAEAWWLLGLGLALAAGLCASGQVRSILSAFAATGLGVFRSLRGDVFQIWSPPASARAATVTELTG